MRSAKDSERFPYKMSTVCYMEVEPDGTVRQIPHKNKSDRIGVLEAYTRAKAGKSKIYAVWPGQWSSDLFEIDDLDAFSDAFY